MNMQFIVEQKQLFGILAAMQPICSKRTALDSTSSVLFQIGYKELILKSTDLEISLQSSCNLIESTIKDGVSFLVSGKRIFDVVKELEGPIVCKFDDKYLTLNAGSVNLALNIKDAQEFPPFPERIENLMHLDASLLSKMLDSVAFLIPQNNVNPALNGLFLEISPDSLIMTTTDGHCLAQVSTSKTTLATPCTWLLPRRAIFELKKILESSQDKTLFLGVCGNQLVFSGELFNFFTKILADQFPQYKTILDKTSFIPASIDRTKFVKTLRRSACLLSGQFLATKFNFENNHVRVSIHNKEVGMLDEQIELKENLPAQMDIRFFSPYILGGLQAFNDSDVTFYLKNSMSPIIFDSGSADYKMTFLVMPVSSTNL